MKTPIHTRLIKTLKATLGIPTCNKFAIHDIYTYTVQTKVLTLF